MGWITKQYNFALFLSCLLSLIIGTKPYRIKLHGPYLRANKRTAGKFFRILKSTQKLGTFII